MPGYFTYPFEDDEATGYFGGYRRPQSAAANPNIVPVSDTTSAPPNAGAGILTYPNGKPVMDFNTGQPFRRPARLDMQNNIDAGAMIKQGYDDYKAGRWSRSDAKDPLSESEP